MAFSVSYIYQIIDKYTPALKKITNTTERFRQKARQAGEAAKKMTARMDGLTSAVVAVAGAASVGAAVGQFTDFEDAINTARGTTKATGEEFLVLRERAKQLGISTRFSATEAARGMAMLGRNSLNVTQILNGAVDASLSLSAATGTDLANAADISTDVMANFLKKASDLPGIMNKIAGVTINSKFDIDDYRYALGQAGGTAGAVGVTLDDFNTTIASIAPLFTSGSDAGTSFKTFLARLKPESKEAAKIMKKYGIITREGGNAFFDASNNMKSMAEISEVLKNAIGDLSDKEKIHATKTIFGVDAMRAAVGLARVGSDEFHKLAAAIENVSAQELARQRMQGLIGSIVKFRSAMEGVGLSIMGAGLARFLEGIVDFGTGAARMFAAMPKWMINVVTFTAGIAALTAAISLLVKGLIILKGFAIGIAAIFAAITAPIWSTVAVIAAAVAAVGALVLAIKNWRKIWAGMKGIPSWMKDTWEIASRDVGTAAVSAAGAGVAKTGGATDWRDRATALSRQNLAMQAEWTSITREMQEGLVAANTRIKEGRINGNININAPPGTVRSAAMEKTFPGDLGFNLAEAGA